MANPFDTLPSDVAPVTKPATANPFDTLQNAAPAAAPEQPGFFDGLKQGLGIGNPHMSPDQQRALAEAQRTGNKQAEADLIGSAQSRGPFEDVMGVVHGITSHAKSAYEALMGGHPLDAASHVAQMTPLAPLVHGGSEIANGNVGAGAGEMLGGGFALGLPASGTREASAVAPEVRAGGFEAMHRAATKPMIEAIRPGNPAKFEDDMTRAIPILKSEHPDIANVIRTNPRGVAPIVDSALDKLRQNMSERTTLAESAGRTIDGNVIADYKMAAIPPKLKLADPNKYRELTQEADAYRKPLKPTDVQSFLETTNDQAQPLYEKTMGDRSVAVGASADRAQIMAELQGYRDQIYKALDPEDGGATVAEIQKRRGSLISFKNHMEDLNNRILLTPTPSTLNKAAGAYDTVKNLLPTSHGGPGAIGRAAADLLTPKTLQDKVATGFDMWGTDHPISASLPSADYSVAGRTSAQKLLPPATPRIEGASVKPYGDYREGPPSKMTVVTGPPLRAPLSRQLGPGAIRLGPVTEAPRPSVTTGPPLQQSTPVVLTPDQANALFQWQRHLFGEQPVQ